MTMFVLFFVESVSFRIGAGLPSEFAYDAHVGGHHHATEHAIPSSGVALPLTKDGDDNTDQNDSPRAIEKAGLNEEVGANDST